MRFSSVWRGGLAVGVIAALLGSTAPAMAQSATGTGTVAGTITDTSGAAVAGAAVTASGPTSLSAETDPQGTFTLSLPAGIYRIDVSKSGYISASVPQIAIAAGTTTPFSATLNQPDLSSLSTIGRVSSQSRASQINTGSAVSNFIPATAFAQNGNPQINDVLQHDPNVTIQHMGSQPDTTIIVGAVQPYETQVLIDGHPIALGQFGVFLTQYFPSYLIGGIETQSGPGNTTPFANLAVGGTANITTPAFTSKTQASYTYGIDNYDTQAEHINASGSIGHLQYVVAAGTDGVNGYYQGKQECIVSPYNGALSNTSSPSTAIIQNCELADGTFFSKGLLGKLRYNFSPATSLDVTFIGAWGGYYPQGTAWGLSQGMQTITQCNTPNGLPNPLNPAAQCGNPNFNYLVGKNIQTLSWYTGSTVYNNQDLYNAQFRTTFGNNTLLIRPYIGDIEPEVILGAGQSYQPSYFSGPGLGGGATGAFAAACNSNYDNSTAPSGQIVTINGQQECFGSTYTTYEQDKLYGSTFQISHPVGDGNVNLNYDFHGQSTYAYINNPAGVSVPFSTDRYSTFSVTSQLYPVTNLGVAIGLYSTQYVVNGVEPVSTTNANLVPFMTSTTRFDPHIAFTYRADRNTSYRIAYGNSTTFPYVGQVSGLATYETPAQSLGPPFALGGTLTEKNPSLLPEESIAYTAGADHRFSNGSVLSVDLQDQVIHDVFETLTTSTINPNTGGLEGIFSPINVARLLTKSATLKYNYSPAVGLGINIAAQAASSYAQGLPAGLYTAGTPGFPVNNVQICGNGVAAPGIPTCIPYLKGYGQITYAVKGGGFIGLGVDYEGKNNAYFQPPMALVDLTATRPITKNLEFLLGVQNLLNTNNYGTYLSTPNAGTPIVAGTLDAAGNIQQTSFVASRISAPARTARVSLRLHIGP
jgi:hypothetical protein